MLQLSLSLAVGALLAIVDAGQLPVGDHLRCRPVSNPDTTTWTKSPTSTTTVTTTTTTTTTRPSLPTCITTLPSSCASVASGTENASVCLLAIITALGIPLTQTDTLPCFGGDNLNANALAVFSCLLDSGLVCRCAPTTSSYTSNVVSFGDTVLTTTIYPAGCPTPSPVTNTTPTITTTTTTTTVSISTATDAITTP